MLVPPRLPCALAPVFLSCARSGSRIVPARWSLSKGSNNNQPLPLGDFHDSLEIFGKIRYIHC